MGLWIGLIIVVLLFLIFVLPGFFIISANQVGIMTRKNFGKRLPEGRIIARLGEIGVQAYTVMPGFYWRFRILWSVTKAPVTLINQGEIGLVISVDGKPLPAHRLLGDEIECDSFQDAKAFLEHGGYKGPQIGFLRPGTYRINLKVFTVKKTPAVSVGNNTIGVAVAKDGEPLPNGYIVAPQAENFNECKFYQEGQKFITNHGYRGPQLETLQPGIYYINTDLFDVTKYNVAEVPPGYVAILRSNVGKELTRDGTEARPFNRGDQGLGQAIHDETETLLIPDKNTRGIWREPVAPGKYNLNPVAFTAYLVPTSAVTIDWAAGQESRGDTRIASVPREDENKPSVKANEFFKFSQLRVTSQDGFQLDVDVRLVVRIIPEHAAYIIARFGSVENLIEQIVHPLIDSSFRNKAGEKKALDFIKGRTELQKEALERAKAEFEKYFVEAQNLLIAYIRADEALLKTQTEREIAVQQQMQYEEQAKAQEKNIVVKEKEARSDKQKDVINAKLSIDINSDNATASIRQAEGKKTTTILEAEGRKQAIILEAEGIQFKNQAEGEGLAKSYNAQREALGQDNILMIQIIEKMAAAGMKMVPDVYVGNSGESGINTALLNVAMLRAIPGMEKLLEIKTPKAPDK